MTGKKKILNLAQLAKYEVKVPGELDPDWSSWYSGLTIAFDIGEEGTSVSTITGIFDQAGLHSLLRRLYSFGLPIISVIWVDFN